MIADGHKQTINIKKYAGTPELKGIVWNTSATPNRGILTSMSST